MWIGKTNDLLYHFMNKSQVAGTSLCFLAQTRVIGKAGKMTGNDNNQIFIIQIECIALQTFNA